MFYENWMSYIKDEAELTKTAMPGSHNACTAGMIFLGRCQDDGVLNQYRCGVRRFSVRLKFVGGKVHAAHSLATGKTGDEIFREFGEMVKNYDDFFFMDVSTYPDQPVGPFVYKCSCEPERVDELIEKYLEPEKYALTDIDDLAHMTFGDLRKSGKKFLIHNGDEIYAYSRDTKLLDPWNSKEFGYRPEKFAGICLHYLRELESEGFFVLQTQLTPGAGTENGITKWPPALDKILRPVFPKIMADIAADPELLRKVNIVSGDFMTKDTMKINEILKLNLLKGAVREDIAEEYAAALK